MSTNVFVDAGYTPDIATIKALRSDLASEIAQFIKRRQLSQVAAAKLFRVPQPTISKIVNGRVSGLSLEFLIRMLVRVDIPIVMQTGQSAQDTAAYVAIGKEVTDAATQGPVRNNIVPSAVFEGDPSWLAVSHLRIAAETDTAAALN
jgi:predicted XRE-type DNA-binding protein